MHKKAKPNLVPSFSLLPVGSVGTDSVSSGSSSGSGSGSDSGGSGSGSGSCSGSGSGSGSGSDSGSGSGSGSSSSRGSKMTSSCRWPVRPSSNEPSRVHEKFGV